jgi:glycosyltransferase involved in cell wall biosynthesis
VLISAPFPPRLDGRHGGSRAIAQFLVRLASRHSVALAVLRSSQEAPVDESIRKACDLVAEVEIPPVGRSFRARLANRVRLRSALLRGIPAWASERTAPGFSECLQRLVSDWRPDIVQLEYRIMGQFLPALRGASTKLVLVEVDPDIAKSASSRLLEPVEKWAWHSFGRSAARQVDALVVLTERDRSRVAELAGSTPVVCIPLGYALPERPLDPQGTEPRSVVFVGSFIHPPNIDSAVRLARSIFPSVRKRLPDATLRLVGSHAPDSVLALAGDGVSVHADVPDIRPYLDAGAVVASPIRLGGGMRVKILEAITSGKAVVASPVALEGLPLRDGREVVVAERDGEFVDAIVTLLRDPVRRVALARAARRWAEEHLDLDISVRAYEDLYEFLTTGGSGSVSSGVGARELD